MGAGAQSPPRVLKKRKPYYGWFVVGGGFVAQMITGINHQGLSTYLPLLEREFGWSKTLLSAPRSLGQIESTLLGPATGYLADRLGPRIMISSGVILFGVGLVLFGFVHSIWSFISVFVIMSIGASLSSLLVVSTAINNWFRLKRTLGIGLATTGLGVSGMIAVPLILLAQEPLSWRMAAIISGLLVLIIGVPAALLMRSPPRIHEPRSDEVTGMAEKAPHFGQDFRQPLKEASDYTVWEALHTPTFWFLSFGSGLGMFAMSAVSVHQFFQMEQGIGLDKVSVASVIMVMNMFNIGGRLVGAFLGDRVSKRILLSLAVLGTGIAICFLASADGVVYSILYGIIYGMCWGIRTPISNAIIGEYFGRTRYGSISGCSQGISSPFSIAGPLLVGLLADIQKQYDMALYLLVFASLAAAVLIYLASEPNHPLRSPGDHG